MPKRKPATEPASPPQPIVYTMELRVPVTLVAFRQQDAVGRLRQFAAALAGLVDATAGEACILGDGKLTVQSREPLPLAP